MRGPERPDGNGSEPPRALAIVLASVIGIVVVAGLLLLINWLN